MHLLPFAYLLPKKEGYPNSGGLITITCLQDHCWMNFLYLTDASAPHLIFWPTPRRPVLNHPGRVLPLQYSLGHESNPLWFLHSFPTLVEHQCGTKLAGNYSAYQKQDLCIFIACWTWVYYCSACEKAWGQLDVHQQENESRRLYTLKTGILRTALDYILSKGKKTTWFERTGNFRIKDYEKE